MVPSTNDMGREPLKPNNDTVQRIVYAFCCTGAFEVKLVVRWSQLLARDGVGSDSRFLTNGGDDTEVAIDRTMIPLLALSRPRNAPSTSSVRRTTSTTPDNRCGLLPWWWFGCGTKSRNHSSSSCDGK